MSKNTWMVTAGEGGQRTSEFVQDTSYFISCGEMAATEQSSGSDKDILR